jgi:hypothetical protein
MAHSSAKKINAPIIKCTILNLACCLVRDSGAGTALRLRLRLPVVAVKDKPVPGKPTVVRAPREPTLNPSPRLPALSETPRLLKFT